MPEMMAARPASRSRLSRLPGRLRVLEPRKGAARGGERLVVVLLPIYAGSVRCCQLPTSRLGCLRSSGWRGCIRP
jgi:hypothetical protein